MVFNFMPLKNCSDLLFYSECADEEPAPPLVEQFFVGLYREKSLKDVLDCEHSVCVQWARWRLKRSLEGPSASFVAGARVQEMNNALVVQNIGSDPGYGPLLYACMLHLARARKLTGVVPSRNPSKILPKPKVIWERFATDTEYADKISTKKISGDHPEPWLNNIFCLNPGKELVAFEDMRRNTKHFWNFWQSKGVKPNNLNSGARALADLSVKAHRDALVGLSHLN